MVSNGGPGTGRGAGQRREASTPPRFSASGWGWRRDPADASDTSAAAVRRPRLFFFFFLIFIYLFTAVLGLCFCVRAFSSCGKQGPLLIAVRGPLTTAASLVAEHRLQMRRLSSCGSRAQSLRGMWDPPRPGLKPVSPALAGRFSTTAPPGKPLHVCFLTGLLVVS